MKISIEIIFIVIGCLFIVGCASGCVAVGRHPIPERSNFACDLEKVRELAAADPDELPTEVRAIVVATGYMPRWFAMTHGGRGKIPFDFVAYQIVYPDKTVIIDSTFDKENGYDGMMLFLMKNFVLQDYNEEKYRILQESMRAASCILVTHEHFDHIGGIAKTPYPKEVAESLVLSKEQADSPMVEDRRFLGGESLTHIPFSYNDPYHAVDGAPGIVLIRAPGHAPGQQIIYVKTRDGHEYLFLADVIWNRENLKRQIYRPYVSNFKDDLDSAYKEFRWVLDDLYLKPNEIIYVLSHDRDQLEEYIDAGVITRDFK